METKILTQIPMFTGKINNWEYKKENINSYIDKMQFKENEYYLSSKSLPAEEFKQAFMNIFKEELVGVSEQVDRPVNLKDVWVVHYEKGHEQYIHSHGSSGLSGIIYLNYNVKEHKPTHYLLPFLDPITDNSLISTSNVEEGDLVVIPSFINHFTPYNKSEEIRSIIGFDLTF
tara:strand:- start:434 stop:952 length:519 start_codon:yes stop_codon:yes gene_type:complete